MNRWENLVEKHQEELSTRGLSESYRKKIESELTNLGGWIRRRKPRPTIEGITSEHIMDYIRSRGVCSSKAMISGVMSVLRLWGEYLVREGLWQKNPMRWMIGPKIDHRSRLPKRIGGAEMERMWCEAAGIGNEYRRCLSVLMLSLLYGAGMRRGELSALKVDDWDAENGALRVFGQKTGRERQLALPEFTRKCLESYMLLRQNMLLKKDAREEQALLITGRGRPMTGEKASRMLKLIAGKAGVESFRLHRLRHTCASDLIEKGVGLAVVQRILGHTGLGTTMLYTHISDPEKTKAMAKHPINAMLLALRKGEDICSIN